MCSSYNTRGWKSGIGQTSVHPSLGGGYPIPGKMGNNLLEEDEVDRAEENDIAAPLPSERLTPDKNQKTPKGVSAKDKRRIREKRRSTGVATLSGHEADEETSRNTSYNETPGVAEAEKTSATATDGHSQPDAPVHNGLDYIPSSLRSVDSSSTEINNRDAKTSRAEQHTETRQLLSHSGPTKTQQDISMAQSCLERLEVTDTSKGPSNNPSEPDSSSSSSSHLLLQRKPSSDYAKNICAKPFEARRGILKSSRPVVPTKPEVVPEYTASASKGHRSLEESRLLARVAELEKFLEAERKENGLVKKLLSDRDSRIRELELQIAALNEDLDLADEDYVRLEEENRALARALSHLSDE